MDEKTQDMIHIAFCSGTWAALSAFAAGLADYFSTVTTYFDCAGGRDAINVFLWVAIAVAVAFFGRAEFKARARSSGPRPTRDPIFYSAWESERRVGVSVRKKHIGANPPFIHFFSLTHL